MELTELSNDKRRRRRNVVKQTAIVGPWSSTGTGRGGAARQSEKIHVIPEESGGRSARVVPCTFGPLPQASCVSLAAALCEVPSEGARQTPALCSLYLGPPNGGYPSPANDGIAGILTSTRPSSRAGKKSSCCIKNVVPRQPSWCVRDGMIRTTPRYPGA